MSFRLLLLLTFAPVSLSAQTAHYRVRIDPAADVFEVRAEFDLAAGRDTVLLSLPAWSPGSYDIDNYARWVHGVRAFADGRPVFWDKLDKDTWRIAAGGARRVALEFLANPDSAMLQFSLIDGDFAFFNGTNLLVYPEGTNFRFPAELEVIAPDGWRLVTGLADAGPHRFRADNYHDLVDAPVFAGSHIWLDSVIVDGKPVRFAIAPDSAMTPAIWDSVAHALRQLATAQNRIFGGPPYDSYTILFYAPFADMQWGGGLEHHNSQLDAIAAPFFAANRQTGQLGAFTRPLISHELFHLFNVKRIRPAEMSPYDYSREQYTPLLWWSEGVTDYYGDVTLARGGLWSVDRFINSMNSNLVQVEDAAESVSAEDASINTWIHPTFVDEAQYYYPKGSLLGLMLDIQIRDATANRHSLDEVMRTLWTDFYRRGRGFTTADLLGIIRPWFAGVDDFYRRYVNGREPLPYQQILPKGGIAVDLRETRVPFIGVVTSEAKDGGVEVGRVAPNSVAAEAGVQSGDILLRVGEVTTADPQTFGGAYRQRYTTEGETIQLSWRRAGQPMTGRGSVTLRVDRNWRLLRDPNAALAARAILDGITQ
jgi:predicted metalloprotease with PDZ domain